ncbi:MAG: GTP-binding protein, partial [Ruminiclostridium sp.]|nr:GTP-binding protein [Ruminiclostridium sp.]
MKRLTLGILAHVDAGKTTLTEALLYGAGEIRKLGRVDHRDAFLDTHSLERSRGITIFSKQAVIHSGETEITLLDTPGHVDFSAETERVLQVLDYAVLLISGTDGVQSHTETLWRLLRCYRVPVFVFVNKMDLAGDGKAAVLSELRARLDGGCTDFSSADGALCGEVGEAAALCSEELMETFLETGEISVSAAAKAIAKRKLFPCYFGSALKLDGVDRFFRGLCMYT